MNWDALLRSLDKAERRLERLINWGLMAAAGGLGAWVVWTITGDADLGLFTRLVSSLVAALICAALIRLFLFVGRFFV